MVEASLHRPEARVENLGFCLVVTSESLLKGLIRDEVTPLVERILAERGHRLVKRLVVGNNVYAVMHAVLTCILDDGVDVVLVTGGSGPSPRDVSVDAVKRIADRVLPGFGEAFRRLSMEEGVLNAMLSRASAYIIDGKPVFVTPGSPSAVKLALEKLILPVVGHLVYELRRR